MDDFGEVFECPLTWYESSGMGKMPWNTSLEPFSSETSCRLSGSQPLVTLLPTSSADVISVRGEDHGTQSDITPAAISHHYSHHDFDDAFLVSQWTQSLGLQGSLLPSTTECCYQQQIGADTTTHMLRGDMQLELHNNPTTKRCTSYEGWVSCQGNKVDQEKPQQIKCTGQYAHTQGGSASATGTSKPRQRARRGQATDPHSIAERLRRERIANRIKELQELVPNSNKVDRISLLDDIIEYVRFLQLQAKVFNMSRLGGAGAIAPLVADISEGQNQSNTDTIGTQKDDMEVTEQEVAKLMESNISLAMRYLQSKGLCLMPISLVTAISSMDNRHSTDDSEVYTSCV